MKRGMAVLWAALACCILISIRHGDALYVNYQPQPVYGGAYGASLMFNVYQNTEQVEQILDILDAYGVKASFFIGGVWAQDNQELVKRIHDEGHDVGNHGYLHKLPTKAGPETTAAEIRRTNALLEQITGAPVTLYAPPSGDFDSDTASIAAQEGCLTILWSADTIDWRDQDAGLITDRALTKTQEGGFLLMHPTQATVQALPGIIDGLREKNLLLIPVSQSLAE